YGEIGDEPPDVDDPKQLKAFAEALTELKTDGLVLAYHDRSDGGLFATLAEMAFAGHCGLDVSLSAYRSSALAQLFAEELGAVLQVREADEARVKAVFAKHGLDSLVSRIGVPVASKDGRDATGLRVRINIGDLHIDESWIDLRRAWSETSWQ